MTRIQEPDRLVVPGVVLGLIAIVIGALFWTPLLWGVGGIAAMFAVYHFAEFYKTYLGLLRKDTRGRE